MTTPQITIHNVLTGEIVTRDFNKTELAQLQSDNLAFHQITADATERANARQALLDKLGITADEAQLLLV